MSYKFKFGNTDIIVPKMSEIPTSLPANGGNADSVGGYPSTNLLVGFPWWNTGSGQNVNNDMNNMHFAYSNHNCPTNGMVITFGGAHRSYPLQIQSTYNGGGLYYRNRNDDGPGWTSWQRLANASEIADTGWVNCSYGGVFSRYSNSQAPLQVRKIGNIVHLRGALINSSTINGGSENVCGYIPSWACPSYQELFICQGSGLCRFALMVKEDGSLIVARYGQGTAYTNPGSGTWFNLYASWMV